MILISAPANTIRLRNNAQTPPQDFAHLIYHGLQLPDLNADYPPQQRTSKDRFRGHRIKFATKLTQFNFPCIVIKNKNKESVMSIKGKFIRAAIALAALKLAGMELPFELQPPPANENAASGITATNPPTRQPGLSNSFAP
jgi:hypothetical protein